MGFRKIRVDTIIFTSYLACLVQILGQSIKNMISHLSLGLHPDERKKHLASLIKAGKIKLGGYKKNKIYGLLNCSSGKRMKVENRVFFKDEKEALQAGYRPCGHCLPEAYNIWKLTH